MLLRSLHFLLLWPVGTNAIDSSGDTTSLTVNQNYNQVAAFDHGDVVGEYKLEQRLDYLGSATEWLRDDHPGQKLLVAPDNRSPEIVQLSTFGYLTVAKEIRMNVNSSCIRNGTYCLDQHIFRGGHGEIWRARQILPGGIVDQKSSFILKRMHIKDRSDILRCARREIFFGEKLRGVGNVARFITFFHTDDDYWLVFQDEGVSLQKLLYSVTISKVSAVVEPSLLWRKLRSSKGASSLRGIMHQVISSLAALHQKGVTHRDVKPSNILLNTEAAARILMADLSSAVSEDALNKGLYGKYGPLIDEETLQYAPPEVLLSISTDSVIPYDLQHPHSYDSWSVGVVFLEMILGTSDVFTVDQRTAAMIAHRMKRTAGVDDKKSSDAMLLAALADYCIYRREDSYEEDKDIRTGHDNENSQEVGSGLVNPNHSEVLVSPTGSTGDGDARLSVMAVRSAASTSQVLRNKRRRNERRTHQDLHPMVQSRVCGLEDLRLAILRRDPLGTGISDEWQLDLISRLLRWEPAERFSMADALAHAYFTGPYVSPLDGSEHATEEEAKSHISHNSLHSSLSPSVVTSAGRSFDGLDSANEPQTGEVESSLLMNIDTSYETEIVLDVDVDTDSKVTDESSRYWAVDDVVTNMTFTCPKCGRSFLGDWMGCHKHMTTRRHGQRCKYGAENNSNGMPANTGSLPSCLSEHSMLPLDQHSGWCELQGRRRYMEDMHSVVFEESYKLFGVFDGHSGAKAARFASKRLHTLFDLYLSMDDTSAYPADPSEDELNWQQQAERLGRINVGFRDPVTKLFALSSHSCQNTTQSSIARGSELLVFADNKKDYPEPEDGPDDDVTSRAPGITVAHGIRAMKEAFRHTNSDLASTMSAGDLSGSTASLAVQFQDHLLIANVGDSRVVLCCSSAAQPHSQAQSHQNTADSPVEHGMNQGVSAVSHPVQLTVDHTPYDPVERLAVESKGGFVSEDGVYRVNGKLAVSRSLGDYSYASVLSSEPDVFVLRLRPQPAQSATPSLSQLDRSVSAQTPPLSDLNAGERGSSSSRKGNAAAPSAPIGGTWPLDSVASVNACSAYRQAALSHTSMAIAADGSAHLQPLFLILASDGLWDHVTGAEATEIVCEFLLTQIIEGPVSANTDHQRQTLSGNREQNNRRLPDNEGRRGRSLLLPSAMHDAARLLAVEAYVRGSTDNVGVCVVDLLS